MSIFTEEKTSWEQEMLIREAIENAEQGFGSPEKRCAYCR